MDLKLNLLKEFYAGIPRDRAKIETGDHGFAFLDEMLSGGVSLEYGESHPLGTLYKYKLTNISERRMDELLISHIEKKCNVCLYFDNVANSEFCINLDNNHKVDNTEVIPEMKLAVTLLRKHLASVGCEPLIVSSGRGYHVWCRTDASIDNGLLYSFMLRSMVLTMGHIQMQGHNYNKIKANFYPDPRNQNTVSLRLFGSDHSRTRAFSRIYSQDALLDEENSWISFEHYLINNTLSEGQFHQAYSLIFDADL